MTAAIVMTVEAMTVTTNNNEDMKDEEIPEEEPFKAEKQFANLWADTLKKHGRDNESKKGINDFFLTLMGYDTSEESRKIKKSRIDPNDFEKPHPNNDA